MATKAKKGKNKMTTTELKTTRDDSLIQDYSIVESDLKVYRYKVIFNTVKGVALVYYTNTQAFMDLLENFQEKFVITYEYAKGEQSTIDGFRIIKVKLPKISK